MGFLTNVIKGFKEAAKAGKDFNPELEKVIAKIESLHAEGKLDDTLYAAEQAYVKEHADYAAKGLHTNAADSAAEVSAINHFITALKNSIDTLDPSLKDEAAHLVDLKEQMMNILGGFNIKV